MRGLTQTWRAIGTTCAVTVTDTASLVRAARIARHRVERLDAVASRFRPDSELSRINATCGRARTVPVSPLLADLLTTALAAAQMTDGDVDPTLGAQLAAAGYDADLAVVQARDDADLPADDARPPRHTWRDLHFDSGARTLTLPAGVVLDLGATAKAATADRVARDLAERLPGGFLVNLGGDLAVSGARPAGGWPVAVTDHEGRQLQTVVSTGQAFATSSTAKRTWVRAGERRHHIMDPRTGAPAEPVWTQVTCAAASAAQANAAATAAIVRGEHAPGWLAGHGLPARLESGDGRTTFTPGWPIPIMEQAA